MSVSLLALPESLRRHRRVVVVLTCLALLPLEYLLAFALRFDFHLPADQLRIYAVTLPFLLLVRLGALSHYGVLSGSWRHVGMRDLMSLVRAVSVSSVLFVFGLLITGMLGAFPNAVFMLDWVGAVFVLGGVRFAVRGLHELEISRRANARGKRALIIGAGEAAEGLLRELQHHLQGAVWPIGLVDDDPHKQRMQLHGVPVVGTLRELPGVIARERPQLVVIAIATATQKEMTRIVQQCTVAGVEVKVIPPLSELLLERARLSELRDVSVEDLLGRQAVELDLSPVQRELTGKTVLITGGAGSIGSELARQIASFGPSRLILVEQAESPLYFTSLEVTERFPGVQVVPVMGSVTDQRRMRKVFADFAPSHVFHAAAYKHVPMMQEHVEEAVRNNIVGTLVVASCAAESEVAKFVLISTDKAVRPSNVMGATKRVAERIVLGLPALKHSGTDFRAVRFGNVLGSDGSVVPLFRRKLARGEPLTVTHAEVTRYFMTIPEAVQLVLQATALREAGGMISMLDMGEPVRIVELAESLIRLSGLVPYEEVPIVFTGLRPGEKLHEELMSELEETIPTAVEKIRVLQTDEVDGAAVEEGLDHLIKMLAHDRLDVLAALCRMVPECVDPLRGMGVPRSVVIPIAGSKRQHHHGSITLQGATVSS